MKPSLNCCVSNFFPIYGIIQQVDNVVNSNYHAMNFKVQQRFARGLSLLLGYTWSKSIDDASGVRSLSGEQSIAKYDWDLRSERGLSQFHTGHRLVSSVLYEIPFFAGAPKVATSIFGGWQVSGIMTFLTGNPVRIGVIGDTNAIGGEVTGFFADEDGSAAG